MSIQTLPTPSALPAVGQARAGLDAARSVALAHVADDELGDLVVALAAVEAQAAALKGAVLMEAERRRTAASAAATGTDAWAAALTGESRETVAGGMRWTRLLEEKYSGVREAFAAGQLRARQVRTIVGAAEEAPPEATPEQLATAVEILLGKATGIGTRSGRPVNDRRLRQAARRMFDPVDRDLADRHEAILLGRESRRAQRETYLELHDNGDGTYSGKFCIPELQGTLLRTGLERLTAPRRRKRPDVGPDVGPVFDESAPQGRGRYELHGHAFCELIDHLPTDGWSTTANSTVLVAIGIESLMEQVGEASAAGWTWEGPPETGSGRLDQGVTVTASDVRRMACAAGIVPVVLGGDSVPLDLGRERRLFSDAQRKALATMYDTCAIEGCERSFAWTEIAHPKAWKDGGSTDLDNAVPICGWHHHRAHEPIWQLVGSHQDGWRLERKRRPGRG